VTSMHFIGLDIHKKTISYCVKDVSGTVSLKAPLQRLEHSSTMGEDVNSSVDRGHGSNHVDRMDL
jgi:hypothetical protein